MVAKRAIIYNDSKHSPTLCSSLVRRSLLLLGADYQLFLRRGNPPPPTPGQLMIFASTNCLDIISPAPQPPVVKQPEMATKTSVVRTQIYKVPQATPVDRIANTLASDSPTAGVLAGTTSDSITIPQFLSEVLRLRLPSSPLPPLTTSTDTVRRSISSASRMIPWSLLPTYDLGVWWTRERRDRAAKRSLPNRELDLMIVDGTFDVSLWGCPVGMCGRFRTESY